ncbi:MAG: response regulator [Proteobacteria bacterium]|nr:response regulator [Pseudomonadota bacterium]
MRNIRLRLAIAIVLLLSFLLPVLFAGWQTLRDQRTILLNELDKEHGRIIEILVLGIQESLWSLYPEAGIPLVNAIMADKRITRIRIDSADDVFIERNNEYGPNHESLERRKKVYYHGKEIGTVTVAMDRSYLQTTLKTKTTRDLLVFLIPFLCSTLILFLLLRRKIIQPLEILISQSERLAKKQLDTPFAWDQRDEMGMMGKSLEQTRLSLASAFDELEEMNERTVRYSKELEEINEKLQNEIDERIHVEEMLHDHKNLLEETIRQRTAELVEANENLLKEFEERKKAEEERELIALKLHRAEKMEALGVLASGVAHDLNNILAGIVSYPELLLLKTDPGSELYQPLVDIHGAGKRAAAVVADLLTIARSTATVLFTHNVKKLVEEYFNSLEYRQLQKLYPQVRIDFHCEASIEIIACSPVHVKKCLMNLVTNAVEATGHSGVITVSISNKIKHGEEPDGVDTRYVVVSVADSGTGISARDLERIFEPFYTTKQMGMSGSGLGLAVVWNTMQEHNGWVTVDSNSAGTCFRLYFPCATETDNLPAEKNLSSYLQGNNEKLLVVDDEPLLLRIAERMLGELGYRVVTVSSGEKAIEYLRSNAVDAVILDMVMEPGINGRETYEQIVQIHPGQKAMIVSGYAVNDDIRAAMQLGVATFLKKPYSMAELAHALQLTFKKSLSGDTEHALEQ